MSIDHGERASSADDYKITCMQFIEDISMDYKAWVERYRLPEQERSFRLSKIDEIMKTTNEWIAKYGDTIKKIDIIKDDGINKMAEHTAGYPFQMSVSINGEERYIHHNAGIITLEVRAKGREGKKVRIADYSKEEFAHILATGSVGVRYSRRSAESDLRDHLFLDASSCKPFELISITLIVEEIDGERRGYTTLIRIKP